MIQLGIKHITPESMVQYQREERALIATRLKSSTIEITDLLKSMEQDVISKPENVASLKFELAHHYKQNAFLQCKNMGELLRLSLMQVLSR